MQGILIINKPENFTSQDVVSKVKKILNVKKAGHTGTLDPMATGVLPILIENYTKLSKYLIEHDKTYVATLKLGIKTDTGDILGKVLEERKAHVNLLDENNILKVLRDFEGTQEQIPPMYSALKINGKKLYELARQGKEVERAPRKIEIYSLKLLDIDVKNFEIRFEISCSKGTYIRSLCEDIAKKMKTIGCMSSLKRTKVDKFEISNSITLKQLEENKNNPIFMEENIIKMEEIFKDFPKIDLPVRKKELFLNGVNLTYKMQDGVCNVYCNKIYLGTATIKNNLLKRDIII